MSKKTRSSKATRDKSQLDPRWADISTVFSDRVDIYPRHVEWMWWLWCRITMLAGKLDRLLQRPSALQPFSVEGAILAVAFGDEDVTRSDTGKEVAMIEALSVLERSVSSDSYRRIHAPPVSSHYARIVPVVLTLTGGQAVHFCDIDEDIGSTPGIRRDAYFRALVGRTVHAAGYVSEGVHTAMALRVNAASEPGRDPKYLWLGVKPPAIAPRSVAEAMAQRSIGFGQLSCGLTLIYSVAGMIFFFSVLVAGRGAVSREALRVAALVLPLLFILPALGRMAWPLLTLPARVLTRAGKGPGPLPPLPVLMRTSRIGRVSMDRLRSYDQGRMTEWLARALRWPANPPAIPRYEWSLLDDYIWPWVAILLTALLWFVAW